MGRGVALALGVVAGVVVLLAAGGDHREGLLQRHPRGGDYPSAFSPLSFLSGQAGGGGRGAIGNEEEGREGRDSRGSMNQGGLSGIDPAAAAMAVALPCGGLLTVPCGGGVFHYGGQQPDDLAPAKELEEVRDDFHLIREDGCPRTHHNALRVSCSPASAAATVRTKTCNCRLRPAPLSSPLANAHHSRDCARPYCPSATHPLLPRALGS